MLYIAAIGLGANEVAAPGPPRATLVSALSRLGRAGMRLVAVSRFYRSPAWPPGSGPDFVNACAVVRTGHDPEACLIRLHAIEAQLGRVRSVRWGQRTIDLDLLLHGDTVLPDPAAWRHWQGLPEARQRTETPDRLILPHPRLQDRAFVLLPLAEVAAGWRHPVTGLTMAELRDGLSESAKHGVEPV
ncbi:MAG: 2-amino-4-hydroxy-6-hydroxymethyldihydropteridine diphosphokinase [Pseudomonadota bacterium]|jgi:2-amino-4-hydroxy-6-hydroxymethyldihydropteridine diphosphokinase